MDYLLLMIKPTTVKTTIATLLLVVTQLLYSQDKTIETSGDVLLFTLPTVALGATIIIGDTEEGTWQFTKGFLLSQALTLGLKLTIDKERPNMENNNSFPSGHSSTTFQSASFIQRRYGWAYGIPAYLLAGYTAYSRIHADKHDFIDVLAGTIIGIGSTYLFTTPYQQEHLELAFNSGEGNYLLGITYKF